MKNMRDLLCKGCSSFKQLFQLFNPDLGVCAFVDGDNTEVTSNVAGYNHKCPYGIVETIDTLEIETSTTTNEYKVQDGCWNCDKVFILSEYDCDTEYYCNKFPDKPYSSNVLSKDYSPTMIKFLGTSWSNITDEDREILNKEDNDWFDWSKKNKVHPCGRCGLHKTKGV